MARVTAVEVKTVLSTSLTDPQIDAFIGDASIWVDEELVTSNFTANRLKLIEKYLACAFCRLRDLGVSSVTVEDVSEKYQVDADVTDYLLRAAGLDPTGTVRKHFLPDKDEKRYPVKFEIGETFTDERAAEDSEA